MNQTDHTTDSASAQVRKGSFTQNSLEKLFAKIIDAAFRDYNLAALTEERYPSVPAKFMKSKKFFLRADAKQRLLIGSLGWFDTPDRQAHPHMKTRLNRFPALHYLQERIADIAQADDHEWRVFLDPSFVDLEHYAYIRDWKNQQAAHPPPRPERSAAIAPIRDTLMVPYPLLTAFLPLNAWDSSKPYIQNIGGGSHLVADATTRLKQSGATKEMPYGPRAYHLLDMLTNVALTTGSPLVVFKSATELLTFCGYSTSNKSNKDIAGTVLALRHLSLSWQHQYYSGASNISPLRDCGLWHEMHTDTDTLGRQNRGGKAGKDYALYFILSQAWLDFVGSHKHYMLDMELLNTFKTKRPKAYLIYRKLAELGARKQAGKINLGGERGLLTELGFVTPSTTKDSYRVYKNRFVNELKHIKERALKIYGKKEAFPFKVINNANGGELHFYPWEPLAEIGKPQKLFPVPPATKEVLEKHFETDQFLAFRQLGIAREEGGNQLF